MQMWVDVTDTKNGVANDYKHLHDPANATEGYVFHN